MAAAVPAVAAVAGVAGALSNASASKRQAKAAETAARENTEAARIAAESAGKPQLIHQTTEEILHKSPVEIGATGVQGFDLANQWANMMAMSMEAENAGGMFEDFGSGAKTTGQYTMQGFGKLSGVGDGADKDAEYASYDLQRKARQAQDMKLNAFGIDNGSGTNPSGVKLSFDDFVAMRRAKDPAGLVQQGISVNDPIQESEWGAVSAALAKGDTNPVWTKRYQLIDMLANDPQLGGDGLTAMQGDPGWAEATNYWKTQGVISSSNMVNQGQLQKQNDAIMKATMENRTMVAMNPDLERQYRDEYNALSAKVVDPKLVRKSSLGDGVTKVELMNADGTVASSFLEGSVRLPSGQVMSNVEVAGTSLADWEAFQGLTDKTGALFDGKKSAAAGAYSQPSSTTKSKSSSGSSSTKKPPAGYEGAPLSQGGGSGGSGGGGGGSQSFQMPEGFDAESLDPVSKMILEQFMPLLENFKPSPSSGGSQSYDRAPEGYDTTMESSAARSATSSKRAAKSSPTTGLPEPYEVQ